MKYHELNGKSIREGFMDFHIQNPRVFELFEQQCLSAISLGKTKISSKHLINSLRWQMFLEKVEPFKINDAYHAHYSRLFVAKHPEYSNLFEFRKLRSEEEGPYMIQENDGQIKFL